ncbi:MAG: thioredoxin family protein [Azonexus sp.]|jgi:thiol:disulfide interchange protein|nr:thioredoxin family protein [Betaproteobacteria bacterium]MBK8919035.1 thioredoxin family protein [Betaproteobacteria bacterium]MBP6036704.1 thioredoxin family protein [Azonexus sp.]MBP6905487.1 thioredoxin family protein [Azonexus sp.]
MLKLFRLFFLGLALVAGQAFAAGVAYDQARFDTLQKEGKPVLVFIHADWCPICKAQDKVLDELLPTPEMKALTVLRVDYDKQKNALRAHKATMQSTLVLYRGGKEIGRLTGETRKDQVAAFLKQAL